ncbi:XRCC4-like factor-domain-containing protein [Apiosordaria backusii]|uniref:Non-homologous end-joining factor 1 n=1 Tax=Apiosordaria backusii TaxID=314023 RepID=A0AA40BDY3_9PEZI|nr:XRCC4-like factor-domain-containing protein [Apiosordaria backusii]
MSNHPSWRLLPVAAPDIPNLLVSPAFTKDSYQFRLTDLANVWVENMERKPIIKRGLMEDTSIDPSDGPDQIRRMLELLRAAFDHNDPEHAKTSLTLARDDDHDSLVLHVTCVLPQPLKPFKWPMQLKKCPQSNLATELVLPMVQAHEARLREIDQLMSALREKDSIITRLVDKLEATGTGLEHVFNSLSGKRRVTRTAAEAKVKGLAPFSASEFRNSTSELRSVAQPSDVSTLLEDVFGATGLTYKSDLDLEASTTLNDWWTKIGKGKHVALIGKPSSKKARTPSPPPAAEPKVKNEDDDDFQVQVTPSGARKRDTRARAQPETANDDETSSGEDQDQPAVSSARKQQTPSPSKPAGSRIGALGRHKAQSTSPAPRQTPPRKAAAKVAAGSYNDGSETASDDDRENDQSPPPPPPPKQLPNRGGLGRIGGKAKPDPPSPEPKRSTSPADVGNEPSPVPKRHKLGIIGKHSSTPDAEASAPSEDGRGRSKSKTPASAHKEQHRETSQERADRKRAELQRDLEKRAAAGPAKKKRKF